MKKALVLALAVVMGLSLMAMAGPYFVLENDGTLLAPTFTGAVVIPDDKEEEAKEV